MTPTPTESESVSEVTIAKFSKSVSESEAIELKFSESELELIEKNFSEFKPESTPPRNLSIFSILLPDSFYFLHVWVQKKERKDKANISCISFS